MKYTKKELKELKYLAYLEEVAQEIELMLNLKTKIVNKTIIVSTITGEIKYEPKYNNLMMDIYSFIYGYGLTLSEYGRLQRIDYGKTIN